MAITLNYTDQVPVTRTIETPIFLSNGTEMSAVTESGDLINVINLGQFNAITITKPEAATYSASLASAVRNMTEMPRAEWARKYQSIIETLLDTIKDVKQ